MQFSILILIPAYIAGCFWFIQLLGVMFQNLKYFENHTHKLLWFLVVFLVPLVGALWYMLWKRQRLKSYKTAENIMDWLDMPDTNPSS